MVSYRNEKCNKLEFTIPFNREVYKLQNFH